MARQKVKKWGQSCIDGIQFFMGVLRGDDDQEEQLQRQVLQQQYDDYLKAVKQIYVFYHGKDPKYQQIINSNNVKFICELNKSTAGLSKVEKYVLDAGCFKGLWDPKLYFTWKTLMGKDIQEHMEMENAFKMHWNPFFGKSEKGKILTCTYDQKLVDAKATFAKLNNSNDIGSVVCDPNKDILDFFNRFICFTYFQIFNNIIDFSRLLMISLDFKIYSDFSA